MSTISIIMPAYRAETFIAAGVRGLFEQTYSDWRLLLVSDDGTDYEAVLARYGLADPRIVQLSTGGIGSGASVTRNVALEALDTPYAAALDADDSMKPEKLEWVVAALADFPVVSTALDVVDAHHRHLRFVGKGPDQVLGPARHKFVNLSGDTMIAWDCRCCEGRYDPTLPNMNDLDFLMQLFATAETSFHIGTPLHDYVKLAASASNAPGFTERMIAAKQMLLSRLRDGAYPMADPRGSEGMARFLEISLAAEHAYPEALAENPDLLFEDHLEPRLASAASTSSADGMAG